jgi:hypothetical protein
MIPEYPVMRVSASIPPHAAWDDACWRGIPEIQIASFHPQSSGHRPDTRVKLVYDGRALYGIFRVQDCYVRCTRLNFQDAVYKDACVEFFVQPRPGAGHFNFEMNCCGALLSRYIEDARRRPDNTFFRQAGLPAAAASRIRIETTLTGPIEEEITEPLEWRLSFAIPLPVLEAFCGPLGDPRGQTWRANFNKCAEESTHPHWAAWASIGEKRDFHQPDRFGRLVFI